MLASDLRAWGRERLQGHWGAAVAVCFVGGLLGGGVDALSGALEYSYEGEIGFLESIPRDVWSMMLTVTLVTALLALVIGGAIKLGICAFHLNLFHRRKARFLDLFSNFDRLVRGLWMQIVTSFFIFLWTLLFVIPGIIAVYRYAMVPYLLAEFQDLSVMDAMRESKRLMKGNKWRLFCLHFSYIGWMLLCLLTGGIGNLWLSPYTYAGETAFYMMVTGRSYLRSDPQPEYRQEI